ncbi:D-alanyl-D-alanine endopeptidase [Edaphovirga cremea]|uniref:D-alanyl-D-alanine endopeptidase n=1 Tax=Edaphovirga cremea TaxID=2267246 RepID=UPI000DEFFE8A|nr:D-alanyl-D-alanine endopeptidase [Edaphovirga cremea]
MHVKIRLLVVSLLALNAGMIATSNAVASDNAAIAGKIAPLEIASGSAMVVDMQNHKVIYSRNPDEVVPIASITKLMTAMVTLDAKQSLNEIISVDIHNTKEMRGVYSRVRLNSEISRRNMLLLALMSSENRAAASLAHHYPGGYGAFINAMNAKAKSLGMTHTRYVEPTGLSINNVSTARDLTKLLMATRNYPLISELSTTTETTAIFKNPSYSLPFRNTNHLISNASWKIQLTKTGFTNQAGHCLAMRTVIANRPVTLVVLDAFGKYTHFADANRLRSWMETGRAPAVPQVAKLYRKQKDQQTGQPTLAQATETD